MPKGISTAQPEHVYSPWYFTKTGPTWFFTPSQRAHCKVQKIIKLMLLDQCNYKMFIERCVFWESKVGSVTSSGDQNSIKEMVCSIEGSSMYSPRAFSTLKWAIFPILEKDRGDCPSNIPNLSPPPPPDPKSWMQPCKGLHFSYPYDHSCLERETHCGTVCDFTLLWLWAIVRVWLWWLDIFDLWCLFIDIRILLWYMLSFSLRLLVELQLSLNRIGLDECFASLSFLFWCQIKV